MPKILIRRPINVEVRFEINGSDIIRRRFDVDPLFIYLMASSVSEPSEPKDCDWLTI